MTTLSQTDFINCLRAGSSSRAKVPGRVNLMGEHTDYNGGAVLPVTIGRTVIIDVCPNGLPRDRIASTSFGAIAERNLEFSIEGCWSDYAAAALAFGRAEGLATSGLDVVIDSRIPSGTGLSSSAALLVGILKALRSMSGRTIHNEAVAIMARQVENKFLGVPCGIMDQMAVACGSANLAMYLDTETMEKRFIELFDDAEFVTIHSGIQRKLNDGRYAQRREECEQAAAALGVSSLCKMGTPAEAGVTLLPEPLNRRARHQLREHRRVDQGCRAMEAGDSEAFGRLMNQSHASMRDDFEITHPALDALVESATKSGAFGSRMTGGGFGGCFVSLVPKSTRAAFERDMFGIEPTLRLI